MTIHPSPLSTPTSCCQKACTCMDQLQIPCPAYAATRAAPAPHSFSRAFLSQPESPRNACSGRTTSGPAPAGASQLLPRASLPSPQIIALANLRNKATHSAQTVLSHFRQETTTQTWIPKAITIQTPHTKGQSMPRRVRYITGLRGAPATAKMSVVSLQIDLGQPHQF